MYAPTIRKELLSNMLSMRYALTFFLFISLTISATMLRTHIYKKHVEDHQAFIAAQFAAMEEVEHHWQSRGLGITVQTDPNPLAIFASGLENEIHRGFSLSEWKAPTTGWRKLNNPSFRYFLTLDMVLVINIICSLLALLLMFDSVCGEREQGTLRLLLAGPLPRDVVIVSKMVAGFATLLIPLLMSWALSLLYVMFIAKVQLTATQLARLGVIAGLSLVYVTFFFALGVAISSWVKRSATSLVIGLFSWIIFVLAIPNLVPMAVRRLAPIPPQSKISLEKEAVRDYVNTEIGPKIREELGNSGKYSTMAELSREYWNQIQTEYRRHTAKIDRFYNNRIKRQLVLNQQISRLSPSASYVYASTHLAGAGVPDFLAAIHEVDRYQDKYQLVREEQEAKRKEEEKEKRKKLKKGETLIDRYDPSLWPPFTPKEISLQAALNACWFDVVILIGGTVVLFLFGFIGFYRYDPR